VTALNGFGGRVAPFETATFLFGYLWVSCQHSCLSAGFMCHCPDPVAQCLPRSRDAAAASFSKQALVACCLQLKKLPQFENSRWFWMATLVAAIYKGVPAEVSSSYLPPASG
jgi:hypothetical protein